jgi:hypothetical protein
MTSRITDSWEPGDCESCEWFLEQYDREDLYLFENAFRAGRLCVLPYSTAKTKAEKAAS